MHVYLTAHKQRIRQAFPALTLQKLFKKPLVVCEKLEVMTNQIRMEPLHSKYTRQILFL